MWHPSRFHVLPEFWGVPLGDTYCSLLGGFPRFVGRGWGEDSHHFEDPGQLGDVF